MIGSRTVPHCSTFTAHMYHDRACVEVTVGIISKSGMTRSAGRSSRTHVTSTRLHCPIQTKPWPRFTPSLGHAAAEWVPVIARGTRKEGEKVVEPSCPAIGWGEKNHCVLSSVVEQSCRLISDDYRAVLQPTEESKLRFLFLPLPPGTPTVRAQFLGVCSLRVRTFAVLQSFHASTPEMALKLIPAPPCILFFFMTWVIRPGCVDGGRPDDLRQSPSATRRLSSFHCSHIYMRKINWRRPQPAADFFVSGLTHISRLIRN